jgi:hypothetical protein
MAALEGFGEEQVFSNSENVEAQTAEYRAIFEEHSTRFGALDWKRFRVITGKSMPTEQHW